MPRESRKRRPKRRATKKFKTWKEWRRRRALELEEMGWSQALIAKALGVTESAVSQWFKEVEQYGSQALKSKSRRGQGSRLSEEQLRQLPALLERGARSFGFKDGLWTCPRIARVIEQEFHQRYHPDHVRRLMRNIDWRYQRPETRASQRNERKIRKWLTRVWPVILENAQKEKRTIVFVDESGFYMSPMVAKTWSPAGRKPQLSPPLSRSHLSAIGGVTLDGRLYLQVHDSSVDAHGAVKFVGHLLRYLPGPLLLLWDSSKIHTSAELEEFRKMDTIGRLKIEHFPPYAPEVDPQEYVWQHLKHAELRNLTTHSLDDLWDHLHQAAKRLRARAAILRNFARHAGLDI
jgi:transposase